VLDNEQTFCKKDVKFVLIKLFDNLKRFKFKYHYHHILSDVFFRLIAVLTCLKMYLFILSVADLNELSLMTFLSPFHTNLKQGKFKWRPP